VHKAARNQLKLKDMFIESRNKEIKVPWPTNLKFTRQYHKMSKKLLMGC
jgi:hypothetical protein